VLSSRQGRSDRSHFAPPLTDLTGKQRRLRCSDCCATHQGEADKQPSPASGAIGISASPDPRVRTQPRPRTTVSASLDPKARAQPRLGRRSPPRPTPGLGLNLDLGRRSPPRPTPGLGLNLDLGGATTLLRPTTPQGGAIITLPLASPGYGEQDQRPIWLAPVKQVMMAPRVLHDNGGSQPLTEARRRQQGSDSPDSCASTGLKRSSDGHDAT
jgi:hypothetical protein